MNQPAFPWKTSIVAAAVIVIAGFALAAYLSTKDDLKGTANQAVEALQSAVAKAPEIAEKFMTGHITQTFRENVTAIEGTGGNILEVAKMRANETFSRSNETRIAWGKVSLGTSTAEISAPVTFRYHIRLGDEWQLASQSNVCVVLAPALRPSLPPAIHMDEMTKRSESGWGRFDKGELLADLEKDIMPILRERATNQVQVALVREQARKSVAAFVRNWLMQENHWQTNRFTSIIVFFPDETNGASPDELPYRDEKPTITLAEGL